MNRKRKVKLNRKNKKSIKLESINWRKMELLDFKVIAVQAMTPPLGLAYALRYALRETHDYQI